MPDFAMCDRDDCVLAGLCERHESEPSEHQSWIHPERTGGDCELYMLAEAVAEQYADR